MHSRSYVSSDSKEQYSQKNMLKQNKKKKKRRKESKDEEIDINNLALALFTLIDMINSQHFYINVKALKKS